MMVSYWTKWTILNTWVLDCISLVLVTGIDSNGLKAIHSMFKMACKTSGLLVTHAYTVPFFNSGNAHSNLCR